jgi:hypothetical protein
MVLPKINAPIPNLATYHRILLVMVPFVITLPCMILNQMAFLAVSLSLRTPIENRHLHLTKPHPWGEFCRFFTPETFYVMLLFETLLTYRVERAFPRLLPV